MKRTLFLWITLISFSCFLLILASCGRSAEDSSDNTAGDTETAPATTATVTEASKPISADGAGLDSYTNPLLSCEDEHTWARYGVGDPFVMRYNGRYYLYCSTLDGSVGIQCWTSEDLIHWEYTGLCATEPLTRSAYAPEVTYYNGAFYLYTSPAGNGHYVLKSDSPTGPFTAVTGNFGLSIDGHVFIDDDGKWYFYSASGEGIMAYRMSAPDTVIPTGYNTGTGMNGWTEGAMVIKVDGVYYMTYTGNHVLSKGYRINYATSTRSPLRFTVADNNPILLSTSEEVNGIGHSSTVLGPDLDSYYIVYHSLLDRKPNRDMRIDRIVFNGGTLSVLGPTVTAQQKSLLPTVYCCFEETAEGFSLTGATLGKDGLMLEAGQALSHTALSCDYTAEYNLLSVESGNAGVYFSYLDGQNYGKAYLDTASERLIVILCEKGVITENAFSLVRSFNEAINFAALQKLTVKKEGKTLVFLVNDRTLCSIKTSLGGGKIGYFAQGKAKFGFIGGQNAVNGSSVKTYYKPIPGDLQAIDTLDPSKQTSFGDIFALKPEIGSYYNYTVNVADDCCDLSVRYQATAPITLEVYQNERLITTLTLPSTDGYETAIHRGISLTVGYSALTFRAISGEGAILSYGFSRHEDVVDEVHDYDTGKDTPVYSDGSWRLTDGKLTLDGGSASVGKYLYGSPYYGDYTVEADITPAGSINFGILVRATNPALGDAGNSAPAGSDFLQGYFIGLSSDALVLGKQNYNWKTLTSAAYRFVAGETYHLSVTVEGATITASVNGETILVYTDPDPYVHGMAGLRGHYSVASVDNVTITPLKPS